ncbi:DUF3224 domain-containing protein [Couchioplanes caeruleus]|uniref:DUF3224 domain-containing protein n=2 Tax=Couchioplanes caeruleus TaxID=56438 RepID=A0A1K0FIN7_9ACTN|nr:DUF3224 domain-containing protein [Couchioplanes caeruleus]OJF12719.1 hypothetical protein BG844_19070 [Couchioplanes caeruleus subsp. caeruleus]ROP29255.1 uncharacterized protein DUF3224 [Couchioplanes caeruleus]
MTRRATGTFSTVFEPLPIDDDTLGRTLVLKTIEGDLTGSGRAEMLSVGTPIDGSAGYVAIDRITGTLHGRSGSFVLQHYGLMNRGAGTLVVEVVPDSGTDQLTGLSGTFQIENDSEGHRYTFDYELAPH